MHAQYGPCMKACENCAAACEHSAASCLVEVDLRPLARCIALEMDCAAICRLASAAMARGSMFVQEACALCARICDECAEECVLHALEHCRECGASCRDCADECRSMFMPA